MIIIDLENIFDKKPLNIFEVKLKNNCIILVT